MVVQVQKFRGGYKVFKKQRVVGHSLYVGPGFSPGTPVSFLSPRVRNRRKVKVLYY